MFKRDGKKIKDIQFNRNVALYFYGYTYEDIAEILNNKKVNVYSSLSKNKAIEEVTPKKSRVPYTFMPKEVQELLVDVKDKIQTVYLQHKTNKALNTETEDAQTTKSEGLTYTLDTLDELEQEPAPAQDIQESGPLQETGVNILHQDLGNRVNNFRAYVAEEEGLVDEKGQCVLCGGKGWVMQPSLQGLDKITCPSCLGRVVVDTSGQSSEEKQLILERLIPNQYYRDNPFDHEAFSSGVKLPLELRGRSFDMYRNFMDDVLVGLQMKQVPNKSYYIVAPDGYGKKWFAYEVIKVMVEMGMKTTGMLNTIELSEAIDARDYKKLDGLLDTEIMMLNLSSMTKGKYAHVIQYLTDEADRRGVPLFIFARVEAYMLVYGDPSLAGLIYNQTDAYNYGQLQQVGITGREHKAAYEILSKESKESIGLTPTVKQELDSQRNRKYNR